MQTVPFPKSIRGFTLIELLVVMAIILILAGILTPVIQKALIKARMTYTLNNGKNIHHGLFAHEVDTGNVLPQSSGDHAFARSTDHWKYEH